MLASVVSAGAGNSTNLLVLGSLTRYLYANSPSISSSSAQSVFDLDATAAIVVDWLMLIGI